MLTSRRALVVGLLILITAVAFEAQAVSTAMPAVAADLGNLDLYAWAFTAFVIPQLVAIVVGGRLADAVGPVRPLQLGVVIFAVGVVASACAPAMQFFLLGRFIQGFGGGLVNVSLMVVVGRAFPASETSRVMTYFSFAWMLPSFVGPSASAWIVRVASWHWVFWAILPLVVVGSVVLAGALSTVSLPGLHDPEAAKASIPAAVLAAVGVSLAQASGIKVGWWTPPVLAVGIVLLALALPKLMPSGWRPFGRGIPAVIAVRCLVTGSFFAAWAFLPLMLTTLRGQPLEIGGLILTIASLGWTFGSWMQSQAWMRLSRDRILTVGAACTSTGFAFVGLSVFLPVIPIVGVGATATLAGIGMGLGQSSQNILVMLLSDDAQLGRNMSALQVGESVGSSTIAGLAGIPFAYLQADQTAAFGVPLVLVTIGAALGLLASRRVGFAKNLALEGDAS